MAFKAAGAPCDLARENILLNPGSYTAGSATQADSDDYRFNAITSGVPSRVAHLPDSTAYSTQPKTDSWLSRCRWGWSPANVTSDGQAGSLTWQVAYWKHKHVQATGVTTVSISQGVLLHGFVLNQKSTAATSTSLVTIYDATTTLASTDAHVVGICDIVGVSAADYIYDAELDNGITINVGGGATPVDLTVLYR